MTRFSPRSRMRFGNASGPTNSRDGSAGIQYWRNRFPIGVPGPTRQMSSFSSVDNTHFPRFLDIAAVHQCAAELIIGSNLGRKAVVVERSAVAQFCCTLVRYRPPDRSVSRVTLAKRGMSTANSQIGDNGVTDGLQCDTRDP